MRKVLLLLLIATSFGCMSAETKIEGNWEQQSESNAILANMGGSSTHLALNGDHKFALDTQKPDLTRRGQAKPIRIEGTWKLEDHSITFATTLVNGKPLEEYKKEEAEELSHVGSDFLNSVPGNDSSENAAAKAQLQDMIKKAFDPKMLEVGIPESGDLSDSYRTLTIECQKGIRMEFGKLMSR